MKNRPLSVRSAVMFASATLALALTACGGLQGGGINPVGPTPPGPGVVTEYAIPTADAQPGGITTGPDGNLWFTENDADKIGKIVP